MNCYSVLSRNPIFVKGNGFLSVAKIMDKIVAKKKVKG